MPTIAESIVSELIQTQLTQEVMDRYAVFQDLFYDNGDTVTGMVSTNVSSLVSEIITFQSTSNITTHLDSFRSEIVDFTLDINKAYRDNSTFLDALKDIGDFAECVSTNRLLLDALGIDIWDDIQYLTSVPSRFLEWVNSVLLRSVLNRVHQTYPFPEFRIGINISQILHNALGKNIIQLLQDIDHIIGCLYSSFGVDIRYIRTGVLAPTGFMSINSILDRMYMDNNGIFDSSKLGLDSASTNNINQIIKTNKIIINDTLNNLARVTDNFDVTPFIFNVT